MTAGATPARAAASGSVTAAAGPPPHPPVRARTSPHRGTSALGFVIVPTLVAAAVALYPLLYNVWISLHVNNLSLSDGQFAGLTNYRNVFKFDDFWSVLGITLVWTFASIVVQFVIGFVAALALDTGIRGAGVIRVLLLTPWVMPGVVIGAVWLAIYNPISGLITELLSWFGASGVDWLGNESSALPAVIFANVWKGFPFWMLLISAGLKSIPRELHEAAAVDGASYPQRIRTVVLPGLSTVLALTATLAFIWTFNYFDLVYTLTSGGPNGSTSTVPYLIWQTSFRFNRLDEGAAQSVLTFFLMAIAIAIYLRSSKATRT